MLRNVLVTSIFLLIGWFLGWASEWIYQRFFSEPHEPHWEIEARAVQSEAFPLAGFYKEENCDDPWGWAIGPSSDGRYYISFCGPGGCFPEGEYRPITKIVADPSYRIEDGGAIWFLTKETWSRHIRCPSRE